MLKLRYITLISDLVLLIGAFVLSYGLRVGWVWSTDLPFQPYFISASAAALGWILVLLSFRGYNPDVRFTRPVHLLKVTIAGVTGTALFGLIYYFVQKEFFSRLLLVYIFAFGTGLMVLFHLFMQHMEKRLILSGIGITKVLIIGSHRGVEAFIQKLQRNSSRYVPVAILDGYGTKLKEISGVPVLGKLNILEDTIEQHDIGAIVQADNIEQVVNILHFCEQQSLEYYLLPYALGSYHQDGLSVKRIEQPLITPGTGKKRSLWEHLLS